MARRGLRHVARDDRAARLLAGEQVDLDAAVAGLDALATGYVHAGYVHAGYVHAGYVHGAGRRGIRVGSRVLADGMPSITGSIRAALPLSRW
jgi:hypothetical protein